MKATTWLCPVLTLLCATRLVCTAQRGGYPLDYADTNMIQDDYMLVKRNKPSLSIVNPLDVLRQRLLLEIARRQMKENTRQVELNRAILKNVGKRMSATGRRYHMTLQQLLQDQHELQQQHQQQQQQLAQRQHAHQQLVLSEPQQHFPSQLLDYMPAGVSFFDFLQRRRPAYEMPLNNYNNNNNNEDTADDKKSLDIAKYQLNGNEIGNETNHKNINGIKSATSNVANVLDANAADSDAAFSLFAAHANNELMDDEADILNNDAAVAGNDNDNVDNNAGYQLRYLYHLHKNHSAKK